MALVTTQVTWLQWLPEDFGVPVFTTAPNIAISIVHDPTMHDFTKHICIDAYYTCAHVQDDMIDLCWVPSKLQVVDFFTKAHTRAQSSSQVLSLQTQCV